jgi:CrcB protein
LLLLAVGVGGAAGTLVRHALLSNVASASAFPWAVLLSNVGGSFILGVAATLHVTGRLRSRVTRAAVATGFCGGLTTFSTWMVDTVLLVRDSELLTACAYLLGTLVAGVAALYVGVAIVRGRS